MRRVGSWIFNTAAAISLVLCLATCVLWVRSYSGFDEAMLVMFDQPFTWDGPMAPGRFGCVTSLSGVLEIVLVREALSLHRDHARRLGQRVVGIAESGLGSRLGPSPRLISISRAPDFSDAAYRILIRHWVVAVVAAILPIWWLARRRKGPGSEGTCRKCGYDLRATPDRCPECGTVVEKLAEAK